MLHGILFILKIIGILLLAVLGLILAVTLLVLLAPVRYRLKASVLEKNPDVDLRITWLLHLLSVRARYHPKGGPFDLSVRILGIRLGGRKKSGEDEDGDEDGEIKLRDRAEEGTEQEDSDDEFGEEQLLELLEKGLEDTDGLPEERAEGNAGAVEPDDTSADRGGGAAQDDRLRRIIDKIRSSFQGIPEKAEKLKRSAEKLAEKKNSLVELIQDADNQSLFRLLLKQTGGVFRHIRPRKLRLYLHFGFTDPSLTGKLLGYASIFYAYYYKTVDLVPEFQTDTLILEGNLYAKGRIRAGTLLCKGVRLLFNRGCRKMIKRVLKR